MVLRKRSNQISFLHIYHHTMVCFGAFMYSKYFPGGHICILGLTNTFVHIVMYSYYLLALYYPKVKVSYWKKFVTQLQILQFSVLVLHFASPIIFPVEGCTYPRVLLYIGLIQQLFFLAMFTEFYVTTYWSKKPEKLNEWGFGINKFFLNI